MENDTPKKKGKFFVNIAISQNNFLALCNTPRSPRYHQHTLSKLQILSYQPLDIHNNQRCFLIQRKLLYHST